MRREVDWTATLFSSVLICVVVVCHFSGVLRAVHLFCDEMVLADVEVLDGAFFLAFGPDGVLEALGSTRNESVRLTILGCAQTLATRLRDIAFKRRSPDAAADLRDVGTAWSVRPRRLLGVRPEEERDFGFGPGDRRLGGAVARVRAVLLSSPGPGL